MQNIILIIRCAFIGVAGAALAFATAMAIIYIAGHMGLLPPLSPDTTTLLGG